MHTKRFIVSLLVIMLAACGSIQPSSATKSNDDLMKGNEVNKFITVSVPAGWNTYKLGAAISLLVLPASEHTIILKDNNAKIYRNDSGKWTPIQNHDPFPATTFIMEPNPIPAESSVQVIAVPDWSQLSGTVLLRIIVSGNIYDNKVMGDQVQAYVDVTLHP